MKLHHLILVLVSAIDASPLQPVFHSPNTMWNYGVVSSSEDMIEVAANSRVLLSYSPDGTSNSTLLFKKLIVRGTVECSQSSKTVLRGSEIVIDGGQFLCGSEDTYQASLEIYLTGKTSQITVMNGGRLMLNGIKRSTTWTRLSETVSIGSGTIKVPSTVDWKEGDEIVIAPTDFQFDAYETFLITGVRTTDAHRELTLNGTVKHTHYGQFQTYDGKTLMSSAEVGLLTRSIKIYGDPTSFNEGFGVTLTTSDQNSFSVIHNVEIRYAGWFNQMGRYAVHWHNVGDGSSQGIYQSSIFMSKNRCINVHCTNNVNIHENICADHIGFGFLTEEISEVNNKFYNNLGITSRMATGALIPSESATKHAGVATFWTQNGLNEFYGNVAAGSAMLGFSVEKDGALLSKQRKESVCRASFAAAEKGYGEQPLTNFENNVAHSTNMNGFWFGFGVKNVVAKNLQAYKVGGYNLAPGVNSGQSGCIWGLGEIKVFDSIMADCSFGVWSQSGISLFDSVIVAFTENRGDPKELTDKQINRTFPVKSEVIGIFFYDGAMYVDGLKLFHFRNVLNPSNNKVAVKATGFRLNGGSTPTTKSSLKNISFIESDKPNIEQTSHRYPGHYTDLDGTITGTPNTIVMAPLNIVDQEPLLPSVSNCRSGVSGRAVFCQSGDKDIAAVDVTFSKYNAIASSLKLQVGVDADFKTSRLAYNAKTEVFRFPAEEETTYHLQTLVNNLQMDPKCFELRVYSAAPKKTFKFVIRKVKPGTTVKYSTAPWRVASNNAQDMNQAASGNQPVKYAYNEADETLAVTFYNDDSLFYSHSVVGRDEGSVIHKNGGIKIAIC